jgi:hypothetical protein
MKNTARSMLIITAAVITVAVYFIAVYASKPMQPLELKRLESFNKTIFPKASVIIKTGIWSPGLAAILPVK